MIEPLVTLAQTAPTAAQAPGATSSFFFFAITLAMVAFILMSSRSQKKREKREREDMYARLSKNDRVLTIGGIIGTVMSVKDQEVIVKVDEANNTKMMFIKTAIQKVLSDSDSAGVGKSA